MSHRLWSSQPTLTTEVTYSSVFSFSVWVWEIDDQGLILNKYSQFQLLHTFMLVPKTDCTPSPCFIHESFSLCFGGLNRDVCSKSVDKWGALLLSDRHIWSLSLPLSLSQLWYRLAAAPTTVEMSSYGTGKTPSAPCFFFRSFFFVN